jgi:hypothetical protein
MEENTKTTISNVQEEKVDLPAAIDETKLATTATKDTGDESNALDKRFLGK